MLLEKSKLNSLEVLISNALIGSSISHDEFALVNNAMKEFFLYERINWKLWE